MATNYTKKGVSRYYSKQTRIQSTSAQELVLGSVADLELLDGFHARIDNVDYLSYFMDKLHTDKYNFDTNTSLKRFVRTELGSNAVPTYIFDAHNHAFFGWCEALHDSNMQLGATLLHFDQHDDNCYPANLDVDISNLESVYNYTQNLQIYDFIGPALINNVIQKFIWIKPGADKKEEFVMSNDVYVPYTAIGPDSKFLQRILSNTPPEKLIVDFDVDFFNNHFSYTPALENRCEKSMNKLVRSDLETIARSITFAGVVTIATSPGFIQQDLAIKLIKKLSELVK